MAAFEMIVHNGGHARKRECGLRDEVSGVGLNLEGELLLLLPRRVGAHQHSIPARFADCFHHQLRHVLEHIRHVIGLRAAVGFDVAQNRIFAQVITDELRHVRVDRFIVGDSIAVTPPLIVSESQIGEIFEKIGKVIKALA